MGIVPGIDAFGGEVMASAAAKLAYQKEYEEQRRLFHERWAAGVRSEMMADPWHYDERAEIERRVKEYPGDEKTIRGMFK